MILPSSRSKLQHLPRGVMVLLKKQLRKIQDLMILLERKKSFSNSNNQCNCTKKTGNRLVIAQSAPSSIKKEIKKFQILTNGLIVAEKKGKEDQIS